jgi:pyruvate,orthophosphate dikinase
LEAIFGDVQEFEFTVEGGSLYLLQSRTARRTDAAALRIARDLWAEGRISLEAVREQLRDVRAERLHEPRLAPGDRLPLAEATVASPGVAVGPVAFTAEGVARLAAMGHPPILLREDPAPEDYPLLEQSAGVLTRHGGVTSHAAVVARQRGRVCLVGSRELVLPSRHADGSVASEGSLGGTPLREGDILCLDGATGRIYAGAVPLGPPRLAPGVDEALLEWWRRLKG